MRNSLSFGIVSLVTLIGSMAFADIVNPLPATSRTGSSIRAITVQLADGNISTGTSTLWVGKLKEKMRPTISRNSKRWRSKASNRNSNHRLAKRFRLMQRLRFAPASSSMAKAQTATFTR